MKDSTPQAIRDTFRSPNVPDQNLEPANLVDVGAYIAQAANRIATAITAPGSLGRDVPDGQVSCLTEAVVGMTAGLSAIAHAINRLAEAIEGKE